MLQIQEVETLGNVNLNFVKKKSKKKQILLYDTQRRVNDFVNKLKYRRNGKFDDIPHFIVTKLGTIYQIYDTKYWSNTFEDEKIDRKIIKIAIENLGWLQKNTITNIYNNWIDDPYRSEPFEQSWRNYFFWDKYTDEQMSSLNEICSYLCDQHSIKKEIISSQAYLSNITKFNGVVCKSNFASIYTDINPSFNFNIFFKDAKENKQL